MQISHVSDGLEAHKFEDDLVEIEGIWSNVLQSNDEALAQRPCSCHILPKGSCPIFLAKIVNQIVKCKSMPSPNMNGGRIPLESPSFLAETALGSYFYARELAPWSVLVRTYPSLVNLIQRRHSITINLLCSFLNTCLTTLKISWSMAPLSALSNQVISSFASSEDLLARSQSPILGWDARS